MERVLKGVVYRALLVTLFLVSGSWGLEAEEVRLRQVALSLEEEKQALFIARIEESQDEIVEIVQKNTENLFEQMDRLGQIQQALGAVIRDQAQLKLSMADKIASVRAGLDLVMIKSTSLQLKVSQEMGKGQEKMGAAIVASHRFPTGSLAFRIAQEQLGRAILENSVRQRRAAEALGKDQEDLGLAIRDHAVILEKISKEIGRGEERLGRAILLQANMLFTTNEAIKAGKRRLHLAILKGGRVEQDALQELRRIK